MRELKFRVWDKLAERFTTCDEGYQGHYVLNLKGEFHNLQNGSGGKEYVVQQFTGLFDKNVKEIYEGDIIKLFNGRQYTVQFIEESNETEMSGYFFSSFGSEVIGNVLQNPELLL